MTRASHLLCLFHDFTKLLHCRSGNFLFYLVFTLNVFLQQFLAALSWFCCCFLGVRVCFTGTLWPAKIPEFFILFLEFLHGSNEVFAFSIKIHFMIWTRNLKPPGAFHCNNFEANQWWLMSEIDQCFYYPNEVVWKKRKRRSPQEHYLKFLSLRPSPQFGDFLCRLYLALQLPGWILSKAFQPRFFQRSFNTMGE